MYICFIRHYSINILLIDLVFGHSHRKVYIFKSSVWKEGGHWYKYYKIHIPFMYLNHHKSFIFNIVIWSWLGKQQPLLSIVHTKICFIRSHTFSTLVTHVAHFESISIWLLRPVTHPFHEYIMQILRQKFSSIYELKSFCNKRNLLPNQNIV